MRNAGVLFAAIFLAACAEPEAAGPDKFVPTGPRCGHGGLDNDPKHCGDCDIDCTALPGVVADRVKCMQGSCDVRGACASGFTQSDDGKLCLEPIAEPADMAQPPVSMPDGMMTTMDPPDMAEPPVVVPTSGWTTETSPTSTANLWSVWGDAMGTRFIVGSGGTVLKAARGASFASMTSSTNNSIYGLWGIDVPYAAGFLNSAGAGAYFTPDTTGTWRGGGVTTSAMNAIWGSSYINMYLVGDGAAVARWVGSAAGGWRTGNIVVAQGAKLNGLWGSSATDLYAVGADGTIVWTDGDGTWNDFSSGTSRELFGVWGASWDEMWVVGRGGTILRSPGDSSFKAETSGVTSDLFAVWGHSASDVYVVGDKGVILHSTGDGKWTAEDSKVTVTLWGLWGSAADGVTVVGNAGTILHK